MQYSYVHYFSQEKSFSLTCMSCIEVVSGPVMDVLWPAVTSPVTEAVIGPSDQRGEYLRGGKQWRENSNL